MRLSADDAFEQTTSTGRGKLPTWVVRILSVLRFMDPPFLPHLHLLAPIENSYDPPKSSKHTFKGARSVFTFAISLCCTVHPVRFFLEQ